MTMDSLSKLSKKDLAERAKRLGIPGFEKLGKDELIQALSKGPKKSAAKTPTKAAEKATEKVEKPAKAVKDGKETKLKSKETKAKASNGSLKKTTGAPTGAELLASLVAKAKSVKAADKESDTNGTQAAAGKAKLDMAAGRDAIKTPPVNSKGLPTGFTKDRIVAMARDPFWIHVYWELTHQSVQRAEAALGQDWHGAKPILRVCDVSAQDTTSTAEAIVKDILIHGGCNNWYIEVPQPPKSYRVDIGYVSKRGQFYALARSNVITMPKAGASEPVETASFSEQDARSTEKILNMSMGGFDVASNLTNANSELKAILEERLRRPLTSPTLSSFTSTPGNAAGKEKKFFFTIDADLIVYGRTDPSATVTLQGEAIKLRPDGTFTMRYSLPDSRQIIPAISILEGVEERTIVLSVERNTKQLEPLLPGMDRDA